MFGPLPAYAFYIRHADGVTIRNASVSVERPDERPSLIADDVANLTIEGLRGKGGTRLRNVRRAGE